MKGAGKQDFFPLKDPAQLTIERLRGTKHVARMARLGEKVYGKPDKGPRKPLWVEPQLADLVSARVRRMAQRLQPIGSPAIVEEVPAVASYAAHGWTLSCTGVAGLQGEGMDAYDSDDDDGHLRTEHLVADLTAMPLAGARRQMLAKLSLGAPFCFPWRSRCKLAAGGDDPAVLSLTHLRVGACRCVHAAVVRAEALAATGPEPHQGRATHLSRRRVSQPAPGERQHRLKHEPRHA